MLTLYTFVYLILACSRTSAIEIRIDQTNETTTSTTQLIANSTTNATYVEGGSEIENIVKVLDEVANNETTNSTITITTSRPSYSLSEEQPKCKVRTEVYSKCANSCPASCEDSDRKPCRNFCWSGCECAPGYLRNHRWKCIPIEDCPKCLPNEHYRNCGSNCEPTCQTYQNMPVACSTQASCKRGCFCNYGFVRDMEQNGTCVPIAQCPQKCEENEYWDPNGEPCTRTIENPRPNCLFDNRKEGCVCNTGFKRDSLTKKCKPISNILDSKCSANETFSYCGSECALNCFDESKREVCPTICHRGCFCKENYRRESSGRCVLPQDCQIWNGEIETEIFRV